MTLRDIIVEIRRKQDACCGVHPQDFEGPMFCSAWGCSTLNQLGDQLEHVQAAMDNWGFIGQLNVERTLAITALADLLAVAQPAVAYAEEDENLLRARKAAVYERAYHALDALQHGDGASRRHLLEHYRALGLTELVA